MDDVGIRESTEIWNDFFHNDTEQADLRNLINKYRKESPNHRHSKRQKMSNQSIIDPIVPLDGVVTRSMIKRANDLEIAKKSNSIDRMLGWVSATKTKHYLLGDACLDWLMMYYDIYGLTDIDSELTDDQMVANRALLKDASHLEMLFEGGNRFEEKVYDELKSIYTDEFCLIFDESDYLIFKSEKTMGGLIREKYNDTINAMKRGNPIIAQAVMINDLNMTYGIADLLVRSDYLSNMFDVFEVDRTIGVGAPGIGSSDYHYRVIDCKWTTMTLCVDGRTLRNEGFIPAYKGQLAIYNGCLMQMQGYVPNFAYIMSKAWKIGVQNIPKGDETNYRGYSAFDRLGVIDYTGKDIAYVTKTKEAVKWIQRVATEGREWRYGEYRPSIPELYPNMNKNHNPSFLAVKKEIADRYGEITQVWYVGTNHRDNAHKRGITDIRDSRINIDILGITSKARAPIIEQIIDINKKDQVNDLVRPLKIKTNDMNWHMSHILDYYVDFETINYNLFVHPNCMNLDNSYFDSDVTFMIGIGFVSDPHVDSTKIIKALEIDKSRCAVSHRIDKCGYMGDDNWEFVCLYLTDFQISNELELYRLFFQFTIVRNCIVKRIYDIDESSDVDARIFHWTGAELIFMDRAVERMKSDRYNDILSDIFSRDNEGYEHLDTMKREINGLIKCFEDTVVWIDMCAEMQKEPVVVKGCYRYKLKHFANAMHKNGLITTNWKNGKMSDGFVAMLEAIKIYRDVDIYSEQGMIGTHISKFKEIVDYNEIDCRVMWEIIEYLRSHHI